MINLDFLMVFDHQACAQMYGTQRPEFEKKVCACVARVNDDTKMMKIFMQLCK